MKTMFRRKLDRPNRLMSGVLAGLLCLLCGEAAAQQAFDVRNVLAGGTNNVAASTTDSTILPGGGIGAGRHDVIGLLISQKPAATNLQANVSYVFARGINATETESVGSVVVVIPTDTNAQAQVVFTKVDMAGAAYLKLIAITNAASVGITNIAVKGLLKAPGHYQFTR